MNNKNYKPKNIKNRFFNTIMTNGKKKTGEKILMKSLKEIQKSSSKKTSDILMLAIKHTTPTLKMNYQKLKRKKRKTVQERPAFIKTNFLRINVSLKFLTLNSKKSTSTAPFYKKLAEELFKSNQLKSFSVEQKTEIQKQILLKKNLFFKYRWKKK